MNEIYFTGIVQIMNANNQAEVRSTAESIYHSINMLQHQPQYPAGGNGKSCCSMHTAYSRILL